VGWSTPKVSVIVPVLDAEPYLREALDSIVRQEFRDHEILVIDDGSATDVCESIVLTARRNTMQEIRYLRQEHQGPAAARNRGLGEARGEFVAFLDSDDLYVPDKLAIQTGLLQRLPPDYAFVTGGYESFAQETPTDTTVVLPPLLEGRIYPALLQPARSIPWVPAAHLFRRAALTTVGGYDSALRFGEDKDLLIRLARTSKAKTHREVVFRHRLHRRSLSVEIEPERLIADVASLIRRLRAADPKLPLRLLRRMQRESLLNAATLAARTPGTRARVGRLVREAMRHGGPGASWRSWRAIGLGYAALATDWLCRSRTPH
jgi:glycosyltransferase involved in cell wall biosynthesis